ncbi:MAG: PAS domain S-box protein [Clostridiaceae bacterium]|nr:PAS domain S-box protein [Clostridiaceae bacterium]
MKLYKSTAEISLQLTYVLNMLIVAISLLLITYNNSIYLIFIVVFLISITFSFYWPGKKSVKYVLAGISLILLLSILFFANMRFSTLIRFIFIVPLLYALVLKDFFSPSIAAIGIIWIFTTYIGDKGIEVVGTACIAMVLASMGYTTIIYLLTRLDKELQFKKILSDISSRFIGLADIDGGINDSLMDIGIASGVSRSYIFQFRENGTLMDSIYEWCAEDVDIHIDSLKNISTDTISWWMERLQQDDIIYIKDVSKMPLEASIEKMVLERQSIKSLLVLPLKIGKRPIGFIGFDSTTKTGKWRRGDITLLKLASEILANVLYRKEVEDKLDETIAELEVKVQLRTSELEKSKKEYRRIIEFMPQAVFINDDERIVFANREGAKLLGFDDYRELIGKKVVDFVPDAHKQVTEDAVKEVIVNGKEYISQEGKSQRIDGKIIDIEATMIPYEFKNGHAVMVLVKDMTEQRKTEKLDKLLNEALEYDKLKTEFFCNLSHELRTPLNILLGTTQLLKLLPMDNNDDEGDGKKSRLIKHIASMEQNCYRLLRLINNLIDATKIEAGFFEIHLENHNIVEIVEDICISVSDYMESKGINLQFDTEIEEKIIACDRDKIERIILNLLSNTAKFTKPGGSVFINIYDREEKIVISVKDTGIGISKERLAIIFDRFIQDNKTLCRNHEGSGIGLSLVRSLVEMHGGRIDINSQLGKGTELIIELPVLVIQEEKNKGSNQIVTEQSCIERVNIEFSDIYIRQAKG